MCIRDRSRIFFGSYDSGGEGLAFVLQPTGTNANGSSGDSKGYYGGNISNAVVIDVDTRVTSSNTLDYLYPVTIKNGVRYKNADKRKLLQTQMMDSPLEIFLIMLI